MQAYLFWGVCPSRAPFGVEHLLEFFVRSFATKKAEEVVRKLVQRHAVPKEVHGADEEVVLPKLFCCRRRRVRVLGHEHLLILRRTEAPGRERRGRRAGRRGEGLRILAGLGEDEVGQARVGERPRPVEV